MATALEIINRAAKSANILAAGETLSSEDSTDLLELLNDMLHGWELEGINIGHSDLELADTLNLPDNHISAIRFNLIVELAGEYGKEPSPSQASRAQNSFRALQSYYSDVRELQIPEKLAEIGRYRRWRGIING